MANAEALSVFLIILVVVLLAAWIRVIIALIQLKRGTYLRKEKHFVRVLGFIFIVVLLVAFGIISVKLGWFDTVVNWFGGLTK